MALMLPQLFHLLAQSMDSLASYFAQKTVTVVIVALLLIT